MSSFTFDVDEAVESTPTISCRSPTSDPSSVVGVSSFLPAFGMSVLIDGAGAEGVDAAVITFLSFFAFVTSGVSWTFAFVFFGDCSTSSSELLESESESESDSESDEDEEEDEESGGLMVAFFSTTFLTSFMLTGVSFASTFRRFFGGCSASSSELELELSESESDVESDFEPELDEDEDEEEDEEEEEDEDDEDDGDELESDSEPESDSDSDSELELDESSSAAGLVVFDAAIATFFVFSSLLLPDADPATPTSSTSLETAPLDAFFLDLFPSDLDEAEESDSDPDSDSDSELDPDSDLELASESEFDSDVDSESDSDLVSDDKLESKIASLRREERRTFP